MPLVDDLTRCLNQIPLIARRMLLDTRGVFATVPMLRGVWGAALHDWAPESYRVVFRGQRPETAEPSEFGQAEQPLYVVRPAPADPEFAPAAEWFVFGVGLVHDRELLGAWKLAAQKGLGPERRPFDIVRTVWLGPGGEVCERPTQWSLGSARWPLDPPEKTPCRLVFEAPLRILRKKRLVTRPQLADVVAAAVRRVRPLLDAEHRTIWNTAGREAIEIARCVPQRSWRGTRCDLVRYSASQQRELELRGVTGVLELPCGPGPLWPLLLVAAWLHVGKGTVMGLGQMCVEPLEDCR